VAGLAAAFGSGAMTNTIGDIEKADAILVTGSNTTENHPVLSSFVKRATSKGTKLIVVDPRQIKLTEFADYWLRPNLGTDVAWINGLMNVIITEELYAKEYVEKRTVDFEKLKETVQKFTPEYVEEITCIPAEEIREAARTYAQAKSGSILYCMGITQHRTGTDNVKSLANLAMLCGNVGIEGGGVNPLRGQNNVQGACDMGGLPNVYTGYQKVTAAESREKMESAWQVSGLSEKAGLTATEMVPLAEEGKLKSLYVIGENPMVSDPDLNHAEKSLKNLDFLVVQDIFLTETAKLADVVLPSCSYAEKDGTFTNTERRVQRVRKAVSPPGEAKNDWQIICDLSTRMGYPMTYQDSKAIMQEIASVTPSYGGISYERIEKTGVHWPCPATCEGKEHPGTPILHCESFACGLGVFNPVDFIPPAEDVDEEFPVFLTTGRVLYQYHTGTMTRKSSGLNERAPECFVEISPEDLQKYGLQDGSLVEIKSRRGKIVAKAQLSEKAVPGTVFIPFHFAEAAVNKLTNTALDPVSKIPEFKVCAISLAPTG
jgi:formate dehydrogenase alpha subunit